MTIAAQEAQTALDVLETSYSYEPSSWMPAYEKLRSLEHELDAQLRPYQWIGKVFSVLGIVSPVLFLLLLAPWRLADNLLISATLYSTAILAPSAIIWFGTWLELRMAGRRHPLLAFKSRVKAATRRYSPQPYKPTVG